jgi:hypothetical protein
VTPFAAGVLVGSAGTVAVSALFVVTATRLGRWLAEPVPPPAPPAQADELAARRPQGGAQ